MAYGTPEGVRLIENAALERTVSRIDSLLWRYG
jgi:hypothetical protein